MTTIIKDSLTLFRTNIKKNDNDGQNRFDRTTSVRDDAEQYRSSVSLQKREHLFASPLSVEQASVLAVNVALDITARPTTALLAHRPSSNGETLLSETGPETV